MSLIETQMKENRNSTFYKPKVEDGEIPNQKMVKLDQLPDFDRVDIPISRIVDIIPKMLFSRDAYKIMTDNDGKSLMSQTSILVPLANKYAYVVGLLYYENLDVHYELHRYESQSKNPNTGESRYKEDYKSEEQATNKFLSKKHQNKIPKATDVNRLDSVIEENTSYEDTPSKLVLLNLFAIFEKYISEEYFNAFLNFETVRQREYKVLKEFISKENLFQKFAIKKYFLQNGV